jgi:16S rRNA (guanine527-N7)-methyltransferase
VSEEAIALAAQWSDLANRPAADLALDLESFAALLAKWQRVQNLVSRETGDLWQRHIADSLQLLSYLRPGDRRFVDLGSGGGFPAIPLAIALKERGTHFVLVEANARKASFLKTVGRSLGLGFSVLAERLEALDPVDITPVDVITSRALAPLAQIFAYSAPLFGPGTRALLHKGGEYQREVNAATDDWKFDVLVHKSMINPDGVVLEVSRLSRR